MTEAEESFHTCRIQGRLMSNLGTSEKQNIARNINSRSLARQ